VRRRILIILFLLFLPEILFAEESFWDSRHAYRPTYEFSTGYSIINTSDSLNALEYFKYEDSLLFKSNIEIFPLPHRYHLQGFTSSNNEYYLDTGYAYSDILLSRYISVGFQHNREYYSLPSTDPSYTEFNFKNIDLTTNKNFSSEVLRHDLFLRLKVPNYPFHIFGKFKEYYQRGKLQQRYMIGYFTVKIDRVSRDRHLKLSTREIELGSNGHFGPVEIEYTHTERRSNLSGEQVLYDLYPEISETPADIYPHNLIPEFEGSSDVLKLHTSYTGRIVASLSAKRLKNRNRFSRAESKIDYYSATFTYIPNTKLSLFMRLYYIEKEHNEPEESILQGTNNIIRYPIRPSPDSIIRRVSFNLRYRPFSRAGIVGEYSITDKTRSDLDEWHLLNEKETIIQSISLRFYSRVIQKFRIRAEYSFKHYHNPFYNSEPDNSHRIKLQGNYQPAKWLILMATYHWLSKDRNRLTYYDGGLDKVFQLSNARRIYHHNLNWLITLIPTDKVSITGGVSYFKDSVKGPLVFSRFKGDGTHNAGEPYIVGNVPYTDESVSYSIGSTLRYNDRVSISAELIHTISKGGFRTGDPQISDIASLSKLKISETELIMRSNIKLKKGLFFEPQCLYKKYNDRLVSDNSGSAFQILAFLTKKF
jgi:hypothetical protein